MTEINLATYVAAHQANLAHYRAKLEAYKASLVRA